MELARDTNGIPYKKRKTHDDLVRDFADLMEQIKVFEDMLKHIAERLAELEKKEEPKEEPKPKKNKS